MRNGEQAHRRLGQWSEMFPDRAVRRPQIDRTSSPTLAGSRVRAAFPDTPTQIRGGATAADPSSGSTVVMFQPRVCPAAT